MKTKQTDHRTCWGYARVSTDHQTNQHQEHSIYAYANKQGWRVKRFLQSKVSSRRGEQERGLDVLRSAAQAGEVQVILFSELSRLGRSVGEIARLADHFVNACSCTLVFIKENMTLQPGPRDMITKVQLTMFSLFAEIERDLCSERTRSALAAKRASGVKLGRPAGKSKLDQHEQNIRGWVELGVRQSAIAQKIACTPATLCHWLKRKRASWK